MFSYPSNVELLIIYSVCGISNLKGQFIYDNTVNLKMTSSKYIGHNLISIDTATVDMIYNMVYIANFFEHQWKVRGIWLLYREMETSQPEVIPVSYPHWTFLIKKPPFTLVQERTRGYVRFFNGLKKVSVHPNCRHRYESRLVGNYCDVENRYGLRKEYLGIVKFAISNTFWFYLLIEVSVVVSILCKSICCEHGG